MPPASSRGLRSDAPSSSRLSRSHRRFQELASVTVRARQFDLRDTRTVKPRARCLFLAGLRTARDLLQSSVFAISLHPVFAHVVFAQDLAGLLGKAPVSARMRLVAALRRLRPMRMKVLFGRMFPSGQSGRPLFMRRSRRALFYWGFRTSRPDGGEGDILAFYPLLSTGASAPPMANFEDHGAPPWCSTAKIRRFEKKPCF
jgi:hypothetical protein